ncbi:MAG TPA: sugar ABC transporter substrate-binding protein [Solirubrobacteraceae bacterium]|jgi:simple sugar transport system substrate-binding protein|nr:sugar ABC transporter substrate-binding protein [Solirubrobacteraceae bacterium]
MIDPDDVIGDAVERLEWDERDEDETPSSRWRQMTRRTALTGGAAGIAAAVLEACGSSKPGSASAGSGAASVFGSGTSYRFTIVNHVTTNVFFTPTQNGAADACKLLGCSYQWTGSQTNNISEMVNAINSAVTSGVNGIATSLIDPTAFNKPVAAALAAGIPVVAYNADAPGNPRLAYIGQDLYLAGQQMGDHIVALVPSGDVAIFIATPGSLNLQPRVNGALATLKAHPAITPHVIASGAATPAELTTINSYAVSHPSTKGLFAVDGGSTQTVAQVIQRQGLNAKGVKGGGFDLTPITEQLLKAGDIQFTIDQQPYLQGFFPILELYLYNVSQKLTGTADVNTGLKFVTPSTVAPYVTTKSRYEGTSTAVGVQKV